MLNFSILRLFVAFGTIYLMAGCANPSSELSASDWRCPDYLSPKRSMESLVKICSFGPRPSGSEGMAKQQAFIDEYLTNLGFLVEFQRFHVRHPQTGGDVEMKNLIARWNPTETSRVIVCAHYDTRPFPDRDPRQPRGVFVGANDGASGVASILEIAHAMQTKSIAIGVDFVFFDGEEFIFDEARDRENYFLGSKHFARSHVAEPKENRYQAAVLLDMVGDKELQLYYETNSFNYARDLTREIWSIAAELDIKNFIPRVRHEVRDDHLPLLQIAKIPACDIIDFDYPRGGVRSQSYWHTTQDTPDKCSGESLCKVAHVVWTWLQRAEPTR